ncbi:MAG: hypothetical protein ABI905_16255 [Betaproteobacteria bacterium]
MLLAIGFAQAETPRQIPAAPSLPVFVRDSDQRSLNVAPRTSTLGTARTIFANGCTGIATLDESRVASGILAVRINPSVFECGQPARILPFTPRTTGKLRVIMMLPDGSTESEVEMETVAAAHSTVNIDGMWYDPDTTGSGISFHHAAASDAVFGTWFLFAGAPAKGPKWYALQGMQWTAGGSLLVGMAYEVAAPTKPACAAGDDCPRLATSVLPVGSVGVSVLDANNLRVEAIDHYGRPAFVSFVKRLQF